MALVLELRIAGCANNVPVEILGGGEVDGDRLHLDVRVARSLLTIDPALVVIGLLDVLALAGRVVGRLDRVDPAYARSRTDLYDEQGREAGGWRVVAALTHDEGKVRLEGQLLDHRTYLEPGERVRTVEPWTVLAQPLEPEGVLLAGAWHVQTGRGNGYRGVTVSTVEGEAGSAVATRLSIAPVRIRREVGDEAERVVVEGAVYQASESIDHSWTTSIRKIGRRQ
jgi:hypothetical protein